MQASDVCSTVFAISRMQAAALFDFIFSILHPNVTIW
jgi:hypothetical protein